MTKKAILQKIKVLKAEEQKLLDFRRDPQYIKTKKELDAISDSFLKKNCPRLDQVVKEIDKLHFELEN